MNNLIEKIRSAGVVGAGGAGFPAYIKMESSVKYFIANGAECEPLLHKDKELMLNYPDDVVKGLQIAAELTGASRVWFAAKSKYPDSYQLIKKTISNTGYDMLSLGNFYPSGDEYELVYLATRQLIPPGGIPLQVDTVVNNVETLYNIAKAAEDKPVVDTLVTVTGAVKEPGTFWAPVGCSIQNLIDAAGGITCGNSAVLFNGAMMGSVETDYSTPVSRTTSGIIVVPEDHSLVTKKTQTVEQFSRIGKSVCDQCTDCTAMCPRYLLGYEVRPHEVMRSLGFTESHNPLYDPFGLLCCECNICSLYACPEDLNPKQVCVEAKKAMSAEGRGTDFPESRLEVHQMKEHRRIPLDKLTGRLGLKRFDRPAPFKDILISPASVNIKLMQHDGEPAVPVTSAGQNVQRGDVIAKAPEKKSGVPIHASITGKVTYSGDDSIIIEQ